MQQPSKNHQKSCSFLAKHLGPVMGLGYFKNPCAGQGDLRSTEILKFQSQIQAAGTNSPISISTQQDLIKKLLRIQNRPKFAGLLQLSKSEFLGVHISNTLNINYFSRV